MIKKTLQVSLGKDSYPIYIQENALDQTSEVIKGLGEFSKIIIITDNNVAEIYLSELESNLKKVFKNVSSIILPSGEKTKSFKYLQKLINKVLSHKIDRRCLLIAFGGGVIGDLVGLTSSLILRGIPYIQMPTTLLSQVDSSVGGKTAINSDYGKNLIGTFKQPLAVISSIDVLKTLQKREINSGYAEIIKSALIKDKFFFNWLKKNGKDILNLNMNACKVAVEKSCRIKSKIVSLDEKESGIRALLNLGHTFGHVIEKYTNYSNKIKHGEAILIGILMAIKLSIKLKFCRNVILSEFENHLRDLNLKSKLDDFKISIKPEDFLELITYDKKVKNNNINFILLKKIGEGFIFNSIKKNHLYNFLKKEIN